MKKTLNSEVILDSLEQNIFVKDINSVYLYVNNSYANLINQDPSEVIGKNDFDFFPKDIAEKYRKDDAEVVRNKEVIDVMESILVDKSFKQIRTVKKPLFADGEVVGILGIFWDVTINVKEKEKLEKIKYGLNKAQELSKIGHWELDLVKNNLYWSDEVYRIFGMKPQEFGATYESFLGHIHPDDIELVNKSYMDSVNNKRGYYITHRIVREDGTVGFVEERCEHEFDKDGNVVRSIGTVHDITEQKKTQAELVLASEVFKNMHDGVMITDSKQNILTVNRAFSEITGYTIEEIKYQTPNILSSGWHDDSFYDALWENINNNGYWQGEIIDRKKDGSLYTAELNVISLTNKDGILTNYISIVNDISNKKEQEKLIHNLAYFDHLTNLPNRVLFKERVVSRIPALKRSGKKMALLFIDMDNFKNVNDTLGHVTGDRFLIEVSNSIEKKIREQDTLARLGGDEFIVMLEDFNTIENIVPIAEKIIATFKEPLSIDENKIYTGVSMGISIYPDDGETYEELVKAADTAMYQVKASGKNSFKFFDQSMNDVITKRIRIENNLRSAIIKNEFFLVYQPKINLDTKSIYGMEALIRWKHPKLGFVKPDEFISISEDTGQIYEIGLWVLKQAVRDLKMLHESGNMLVVSINVSSKQLESENFIDDICRIVNEIGVDKKYLEFEITESHIMNNIDKALVILKELYSRGFKLSIDDFGTGYSSLSYLKKLPVQTIKIDKSFVLDIDTDEDDRSIVATVIAMARALGKDVIAEGSETKAHIDVLKFLHCSNIQGYYFSKPLVMEEFKIFISNFKYN